MVNCPSLILDECVSGWLIANFIMHCSADNSTRYIDNSETYSRVTPLKGSNSKPPKNLARQRYVGYLVYMGPLSGADVPNRDVVRRKKKENLE